jgi:hypothetical protein
LLVFKKRIYKKNGNSKRNCRPQLKLKQNYDPI